MPVLLIDDDRDALETVAEVLRRADFDIALARTGQEGLRLARHRIIDLVFADFWLADMTGLEVLERLRREPIDTPLLVIIDFASTASAIEVEARQTVHGDERPVLADRLLDLVRSHVPLSHSTSAEAGSENRPNPQVVQATRGIEQRFGEADLSVRSVAHDLGVSTEHLCRLLKRQTGCTFVTLLRDVRVRAACQLLRGTTMSMKQIAGRVGFASASRFDRDFKKVCGVAPSEYRNRGRAPSWTPQVDINFWQAISRDRKQ